MGLDDSVLQMGPFIEKLKDLQAHMPNATSEVCKFASLIADDLNPRLIPIGFCVVASQVASGLPSGVDKFGKPTGLGEQNPMLYGLLAMAVPNIARAVFPENFANEVANIYNIVYKHS